MDLPSNIPTSFVPHQPATPRRLRAGLTNAFSFFAYGILVIAFVFAIGVFSYGRILATNQSAKDAELAKAQESIDPSTVESFMRLRDRLASGEKLLSNHVALSGFFTALETLMPTNVRFISLHLSTDNTGAMKIESSGVAKNFNALATASTALSQDGRIKNAIFSGIIVDPKDGSVSFSLSGTLDSKLIAFYPTAYDTAAIVSTSTPSTGSVQTATSTP